MSSPETPPAQLTCRTCEQTFSRLEHLNRHALIHLQVKGYKCTFCHKTFSRKDALQRHEQIHTARGGSAIRAVPRLRHSCTTCAKARVKCSGGDPCQQCHARGQTCQYARRKRRITISDQRGSEDPHVDAAATSPIATLFEDATLVSITPAENARQPPDEFEAMPVTDEPLVPQTVPHSGHLESPRQPFNDQTQFNLQQQAYGGAYHTGVGDSMSLNWLPFADSSNNEESPSAASYITNTGVQICDLEASVQIPTGFTPMRSVTEEYDHIFRNDRFTDLINMMSRRAPRSAIMDQESSLDDAHGTGSLYVDGAGSRMSRPERRALERKDSHINHACLPPIQGSESLWKRVLQDKVQDQANNHHDNFHMPQEVYQDILSQFLNTSQGAEMFDAGSSDVQYFFEKQNLDTTIQLYLDNFHPVFPFLDKSLLGISVWGWALCLATAAIGARYLNTSGLTDLADQLCLCLHKKLIIELSLNQVDESLPYLQARLLIGIGLCHSSDSLRIRTGYNIIALVCQSCLHLRLLEEDGSIGAFREGQAPEQVWIAWRFRETRRRTGLFIWLTDCILSFTSQSQPHLPVKMVRLALPCSDTLFEADTWQIWMQTAHGEGASAHNLRAFSAEEDARPTVIQSIVDLQTRRRLPTAVDPFVSSIMLHVLIGRIWDNTSYLVEPFPVPGTNSNPGRTAQPAFELVKPYLGAIPEYARWRNSTCDSLDVIHWEALSQSAKASGLESPAFLQLHLSRLVILAPVKELLDLVTITKDRLTVSLPHTLYNSSSSEPECRNTAIIWSNKDKYKARLAVVHAGAIFWHIRKYPHEVFCQSFTVYLAAICLWAYGLFHRPQKQCNTSPRDSTVVSDQSVTLNTGLQIAQSQHSHGNSMMIEDTTSHEDREAHRTRTAKRQNRMPKYMQLDRPVDDELVQYFIRSGEQMTLHLEGVDDLCSVHGSRQVLEEAATILERSSCIWTITQTYVTTLRKASSASVAMVPLP